MYLVIIIAILASPAYAGNLGQTSTKVLRTSTPCIATQTFLDELKKMLLKSEEKDADSSSGKGGSLYTRWGRKDCPSRSRLVYTVLGPANTLCLPKEPEYGNYTTNHHERGYIYGTEYETSNQLPGFNHLHDQDVPCAVCKTLGNKNTLMIPARKSCPKGWRLEYTGYLMGGHYNHAASDYLCVDGEAEPLHSGRESKDGHLFYLIEGVCGPLPCPPYKQYWELTCVVCSQ